MRNLLAIRAVRIGVPLVLTAVLLFVIISAVTGTSSAHVTAYFPRTVHLYVGSDVDILGIKVGKVTALHPDGDRVRVDMTYSRKYKLPEDVKPRDEVMVKALQEYVKANIAPYKYPRAIEFVDALPRTETGKLQRFKLRQMAQR